MTVARGSVTGRKPLSYFGATPGTDSDAAWEVALASGLPLTVDAAGEPFYISQPLAIGSYSSIEVPAGSSLKARPGFAGSAMITLGSASSFVTDVELFGRGTLDAAGVVDKAIYAPSALRVVVERLRLNGALLYPVHLGASGVSNNTHNIYLRDLVIRAQEKTASASGKGVYIETATDSVTTGVEVIGYRIGFQDDGANNEHIACHAWTNNTYGPMKYGFFAGAYGASYTACYADTPTSQGDGSVGKTYGFYANNYGARFIGCRAFLLEGAAVDNGSDAFYFVSPNTDGAFGSILGGLVSTSSSAVKWSADVNGASSAAYLENITVLGLENDGHSYAFRNFNRVAGLRNYGPARFPDGLTNAADDSAAATAGVQIGQLYRNGSAVQIRLA